MDPGDFEVTEPGRYDMPDSIYHADPVPFPGSLSSTGARTILKSPAKFAYVRRFGSGEKRAWDVGSGAHTLVLGQGPELVELKGTGVDENAWRTNADKAAEKEIRARGALPLHPEDYRKVHAMADALRENKEVAELLSGGTAEEAFFAVDPTTKMWLRGKTDYRHHDRTVIDYKTSAKPVDADTFGRTMTSWGYHVQFAFYRYLLVLLGLIEHSTPFIAIAQEKDAPYLCAVIRPDMEAMAYGHAEALEAIATFQRCVLADEWPGYPSEPQPAKLSGWKLKEYAERGVEPVYTDRGGMALERIEAATSKSELKGISVVFSDVWTRQDIRDAANARWKVVAGRSGI